MMLHQPSSLDFTRRSCFVGYSGRGVLVSHWSKGVSSRMGNAMSHYSTRAFLFQEGSPMYGILETGACFFSVLCSVSAYLSAATVRGETPVTRPGYIILQRADHISVFMASLATCAWKLRILSIGSFKRNVPWPNYFGNHP